MIKSKLIVNVAGQNILETTVDEIGYGGALAYYHTFDDIRYMSIYYFVSAIDETLNNAFTLPTSKIWLKAVKKKLQYGNFELNYQETDIDYYEFYVHID